MAKKKDKKSSRTIRSKNPVAKHAARFNRAATYRDRKKAMKRGVSRYGSRLDLPGEP